LVGAAVGGALFVLLYLSGLQLVTSSPGFAAAVIIAYGGVFGLMAGGLVTLRPDHDPYIHKVYRGLDEGRTAVVVHAFDAAQRKAAKQALDREGAEPIRTLCHAGPRRIDPGFKGGAAPDAYTRRHTPRRPRA